MVGFLVVPFPPCGLLLLGCLLPWTLVLCPLFFFSPFLGCFLFLKFGRVSLVTCVWNTKCLGFFIAKFTFSFLHTSLCQIVKSTLLLLYFWLSFQVQVSCLPTPLRQIAKSTLPKLTFPVCQNWWVDA